MPTERLSMRKIREVLRLRWQLKLTVREVARGASVSVGMAQQMASRAAAAKLTWELVEQMDDAALEERLYGRPAAPGDDRCRPDPVYIHRELRRVGVTLELLHLEYLEQHPKGLRYTAFCDTYRRWLPKAGVVMRQVHKAGEKYFVDYSGKRPAYFDPQTGERVEVEAMTRKLIDANPAREQGWRSARGLQRVGEKHGPERTELACARALHLGACSYKPVANILALGREAVPLPGEEPTDVPAIEHENVRGPGYYH